MIACIRINQRDFDHWDTERADWMYPFNMRCQGDCGYQQVPFSVLDQLAIMVGMHGRPGPPPTRWKFEINDLLLKVIEGPQT